MRLVMFAVRDNAVSAYQVPQFSNHIGAASRWFHDQVNNLESPYFKHSEDYDLYELGEFEDSSGDLTYLPEPRLVVRGKDVKRVVQ